MSAAAATSPAAPDAAAIVAVARQLERTQRIAYASTEESAQTRLGIAHAKLFAKQALEPGAPSALVVAHFAALAGNQPATSGFAAELQRILVAALREREGATP